MTLGLEPEAFTQPVDHELEVLIVEGNQQAAGITDQVMMVMLLVVVIRALVASRAVADIDPHNQAQIAEDLQRPIDARARNVPPLEFERSPPPR